ncbi:MAG: MBL fold metallo-hydrolase [Bryobacteraceae bacterium]
MATKKAAAKKTAAAAGREPRLSVRMYRQGIGDCFLITIPTTSGTPFHMMIDCGVVIGTPEPAAKMTKVVEDIIDVTKGTVDLLVATHEHWDHVSGFVQVEKLFTEKLTVKDLWLAWTEDPRSKLAAKLRAERRTAENALRMAVQHLALGGATEQAERVDSLVGFFGARAGTTETALNNVKKLIGGKPRFCEPGEPPITIPEIPGVRFWILGPPQDEKLIKKSNPGKGEAYGLDAGPGGSQGFLISAFSRNMGLSETGAAADCADEPFDSMYAVPMARAEHVPFFERRYFGQSTDEGIYDRGARTAVRDQSWRRIDSTWMESSEAMALQLDSATNNTSLVIAIELVSTGEVLLFPGDAQAGNWLSWQDLKWEIDDPKTGKKTHVTGPDLLARTIFYKVGHHGSHNATLKVKGLELMVNENLMAMIPVDHDMAVKKRWNRMPLPDLVDRIRERTRGRVLSVDDKVTKRADLAALKPKGGDEAEWKRFSDRVDVTELYYELKF